MIGQHLANRYELIHEIGHGGMGVVYAARDPLLEREVAIKMIPPLRMSPKAERRFQREAQLVAQMDHPAIVPIFDFGHHEGSFFLVMQLVEGETLRQLLHKGELRLDETLEIVRQVAEGLAYSHSQGVIHRDIKPENIMVAREEQDIRVRVMDFGLAQDVSASRLTETDPLRGTIAYMSPEQIRARRLDHQTDIYSLGVVLYEALVGEPPFVGGYASVAYRIVHSPPSSLHSRGIAVAEDLEKLVLRCLEKAPSARPASAEDLGTQVRKFLDQIRHGESSAVVRPAPTSPSAAPLVGRSRAMREAASRLDAAIGGKLQVLLIRGDPGTGKSRLLLEIESLCQARGIRALRGRISDRHGLPLQGISELIHNGFRPPHSVTGDFSDLAAGLLQLFPTLSEVDALREAAGPTVTASWDEPSDVTALFELVARTLGRLADGAPMVLLVENLHAGQTSIDALEYLIHRLAASPILIVATYRPAEIDRRHPARRLLDNLANDQRARLITVQAFTVPELQQWLAGLLGGTEISRELVQQVYEATDGNPFFCQELVRSLVENGALRRQADGQWTLQAGFSRSALPATIQQAVEARIENLSDNERHVLEVAAVLGRSFDGRDLEALLDENPDAAIDALIHRKLLVEEPRGRGDQLSFASRVVRDVLYQALPRRRRRSLHRRHARGLEERAGERLERVRAQLVHHYFEGDVADRTVHHAVALGRSALPAARLEEAFQAVQAALEFVDEDEVESSEALRGDLLEIRARAYRAQGDQERAIRDARRSLASFIAADRSRRAARAALLLAQTAWQARRIDEAEQAVRAGRDLVHPDAIAGERKAATVQQRLLLLGATLATLRGQQALARTYQNEADATRRRIDAAEEEDLPIGGRLVAAMVQPITAVDPVHILTVEEFEVAACLFEPLLTTDENGLIRGHLARSWEAGPDHRSLAVQLRQDIRFSDEHPVDARAVKASFERAARYAEVPALSALKGFDDWRRNGGALDSIEVRGQHRVVFHLAERLPIYPALLTNLRTAITREIPADPNADRAVRVVGTGPFEVERQDKQSLLLRPNSGTWRRRARINHLEIRTGFDAAAIGAALLRGEIDLGRDLLPEHLDELLRQNELRRGMVEATRKNVYFILFNQHAGALLSRETRRALAAAVRVRDIVWSTLGRFALPADGMIPPGIFGHSPSQILRPSGIPPGNHGMSTLRLQAAVHPLIQERYGAVLDAVKAAWRALGVELLTPPTTIEAFREQAGRSAGVDVLISRWIADSDDADNFTYELFHSEHGLLRSFFNSAEADEILTTARSETRPQRRKELYARFEDLVVREAVALPLFHDVDYRIAGPQVRGLRLRSAPPYVNYDRLAKAEEPLQKTWQERRQGGELRIPITTQVSSLDPPSGLTADLHEIGSTLFETLTRVEAGARVVPHLASSITSESQGQSWHIKLRSGVRFHDGRPLTTNDVRFTFERLLRSSEAALHAPLLPIVGAPAFRAGETPRLEGLHILSPEELRIDLDRPLEFFPRLLSLQSAALVAADDGVEEPRSWQEGIRGTGPFRLLRFQPGEHVELERNPHYWRPELPRAQRLTFDLGVGTRQVLKGFRSGRYSLAAGLSSREVEQLRQDPRFAPGYRESPRLATFFLVLQARHGPLVDPRVRHALAAALATSQSVRETVGRWGQPATSLLPPGLLGHVDTAPPRPAADGVHHLHGLRLRAVLLPAYATAYAPLWNRLRRNLRQAGVSLDVDICKLDDLLARGRQGQADILVLRWIANYPDADGFANLLLHSRDGFLAGLLDEIDRREIDRLLAQGRHESQPTVRHEIYRQVEEKIAQAKVLLPLFYEQSYRFLQPSVRGLRFGLTIPEVLYENLYEV